MKGNAHRSQSDSDPPRTFPRGGAQWVLFTLDSGRYALPLESVERIVRAVAITPLPAAPRVVLGAIDLEGRILPVFDLRHRFGLPERALDPDDHLLIARTRERDVALVIDSAQGLIDLPRENVVAAERIGSNLHQLQGVIPLEDGMVLIHDLERFLSREESLALDVALKEAPRGG